MWFALLIKTLGVEPVPFQHGNYRDYAVALQQQYQKLRAGLDPAVGVRARIAARTEMSKRTLSVAAQGLVPDIPPPKPALVKNTLQVRSRPQKPVYSPAPSIPAPPRPLPERTAPGRKLVRKCRRKLAHFDFLSALIHARNHSRHFGDHNLNIYPCQVCKGIHIGHRKARKRIQQRSTDGAARPAGARRQPDRRSIHPLATGTEDRFPSRCTG